jgi:hypothetical protein
MRDQLRDEVRAAFQKEQAAHPPASDLRPSIARSVTVRPARRPNLQWVAVAAALLITALVIVSLVSSRLAVRTQVPAHESPSPVGDYGPPPAGVPLFYMKDPDHSGWYVGFDFSGQPRATLKLPAGADPIMNLSQSADGSYFIFRPGAKGGGGQFYDRLGKPVSGNGGFAGAQWADDNAHQCGMAVDESTGKWILATQVPGQAVQQVAAVAPYSAGDQSALSVLACSFRTNRAIVMKITNSSPTDVWVLQLPDGKVLSHRAYSDGAQWGSIVASPDASLLAESSSKSVGFIGGPTAPTTNVTRLSDDAKLMKIDPALGVIAFSADGKTVLVTTKPWVSSQSTHLAVMDVTSGQILWTYDGDKELDGFFVNPAGSGFAVMLRTVGDQHALDDVIVIAGDGTSRAVHGQYMHP